MPRPLARVFLAAVLFLTAGILPLHAATPAHFWSQRFGGTSSDFGNAVAVDGSGNIFVTGRFAGTADFGGGALTSQGSNDIFLVKYNSGGAHQWSRQFGSSGSDVGNSVAVDGSGNVVITGAFQVTVDFGGGGLPSAGSNDIFLAKYSASGVHQWSQRFGSGASDIGNSVAVDGSGNVVMTGPFSGTVDFGGGGLPSAGGYDIFVAKYNTSGAHQWSQRFGSTTDDIGNAIAADGSGNVLVTGRFQGTVDFGSGGLASAGSNDIFLAKYDASGVCQWSQRFGGSNYEEGESVAVDGSGNVVVTGYFPGTVDFGGGALVSSGGSNDIFVASYNVNGVHRWSKRFGNTGSDIGSTVASDGSGNVVVTGEFEGTVGVGGAGLVSAGLRDIFLAKYDESGVHQWSQRFGSTGLDRGDAVAVDGLGNVVFTASFEGTVDFGGGGLLSAGNADIVLARYLSAESLIASIVDIGNDQGRRVRIAFGRSGFDLVSSPTPVVSYEAYRRNDAVAAAPSSAGRSQSALLDLGWVFAGEVPAHGASDYVMDAPTDADSTAADGMHYSVFFIRAATATPAVFYDSAPDSGYSIDNLAPGAPLNFVYDAGGLSWNESTAEDFDFFTVYGSNTDAFGAANLVDYSVAAAMDVTASPYVYYYVTATDFSGNEGKPAKVNTLSGVGGTPANFVLSISAYPNPFNPETTIRYTVPGKGRVTIDVFDARGAHVASLIDTETDAGAYTVEWDGRDDHHNPVGSGVYFGRLTSPAGSRSYKLTLLK